MNEDINYNYDLDYSKDKNIDKRVLEVCAIAEAKFLENQKNKIIKNFASTQIDLNDHNIKNNKDKIKQKYNEIKKSMESSNSNVQNRSYFTTSKFGRIQNKPIDMEKNLLSQKFYDKNSKIFNKNIPNKNYINANVLRKHSKDNNNYIKEINNNENDEQYVRYNYTQEINNLKANSYNINFISNDNSPLNLNNNHIRKNDLNENNNYMKNNFKRNNNNYDTFNEVNNYNSSIHNINKNYNSNNFNSINSNFNGNNNIINSGHLGKSQNNFYKYKGNYKQKKYSTPKNSFNNKIIFNSTEKSNSNIYDINRIIKEKYKPLFSQGVDKKYIFSHDIHIKYKNKFDINKILLQSQNLIRTHKYISAYNLLRNTIATGEYHSDLFYLFGEVNRILENYKNAEDYLLLALNFEIHSPFVFYSMGLLYQDLNKYDYSNIFFKLFKRLINNDKVHFFIAKNYMMMGQFLEAVKEVSIAIEKNQECDDYYKMRSELYDKIGLNERANDDLDMYNYIRNIKTEENI